MKTLVGFVVRDHSLICVPPLSTFTEHIDINALEVDIGILEATI